MLAATGCQLRFPRITTSLTGQAQCGTTQTEAVHGQLESGRHEVVKHLPFCLLYYLAIMSFCNMLMVPTYLCCPASVCHMSAL